MMALLSMVVLFICGASLGVHLPAEEWLRMTALILVGLVPFAAAGITLGHLLTPDSIGPALGGGSRCWRSWAAPGSRSPPAACCIRSPGTSPPTGWCRPATWPSAGKAWDAQGWLVVLGWTVALTLLARRVYIRDTARL